MTAETPAKPVPDNRPVATSPLVAPINDARDVVEQINDNAAENELIEELGIVPTPTPNGDPVPESTAPDLGVGAPAFHYSYEIGGAPVQSIWVDGTTGDRESFDGTTYMRSTGGAVYTTTDPAGLWQLAADFPPTSTLAMLNQMLTLDDVLPEAFFELESASALNEGLGYGRYLFTETALAGIDAAVRQAWMSTWGFDAAAALVPVDGIVAGVPDAAGPGEILITVAGSQDGIVTSLTIEAPSLGGVVRYTLLGASNDRLVIGIPSNVAT